MQQISAELKSPVIAHGNGRLAVEGNCGEIWAVGEPMRWSARVPVQDTRQQTLTVNVVDGFMPFVTNQAGRTIYRFDNDPANPSRTTCFGECTNKWEPVLAGKNGVKILSNKVNRSAVGTIDRPEGKQLTLNGWPLYYFHKDKLLGQTAGYGVGNAWFAIAPDS